MFVTFGQFYPSLMFAISRKVKPIERIQSLVYTSKVRARLATNVLAFYARILITKVEGFIGQTQDEKQTNQKYPYGAQQVRDPGLSLSLCGLFFKLFFLDK